jgi:Cu+-exporting ATPase
MSVETSASGTTELTFPVTGMTCTSCVRRIEKALGKMQGVQAVAVNLATEKARVMYEPGVASPVQLQAAVEKAGYSVREIPAPVVAPTLPPPPVPTSSDVILSVQGMTCASCVRRIEKALNRVDGVREAGVNLATEKAHVVYDPSVTTLDQLRGAMERAGYTVGEIAPTRGAAQVNEAAAPVTAEDPHDRERQREMDDLGCKWTVSLVAGLLMMALTYVPLNVPMDVIAPVLLIAATIVQFWAGRPIYQSAWSAARHGGMNMNTLIAIGTSVAYGYSAFVTLWPRLAQSWGSHNTCISRLRSSSSR